jgi:RNA polymerase sigma factor (sigma-70 family)
MDHLLVPFLAALDQLSQDEKLQELLVTEAAPVIRKVIRRKAGFYVSSQGLNPNNQDAEDVYQEIIGKVLHILRELHQSPTRTDIVDFQQYVARIAANACIDLVRAKSPARARLKHKLRFLLTHHQSFAIWKTGSETLCGFVAWHDTDITEPTAKLLADLDEAARAFAEQHSVLNENREVRLPRLVADILNWLGSPIQLESLVSLIALLTDVKDMPTELLDDNVHSYQNIDHLHIFSASSELERVQLLQRLWNGLSEITDKQRSAFALRFEDENGRDLFTLLLESKVVTLSQLANSFQRTPQQLAELWSRLPMDSTNAAIELSTTREQVHKLHFRARQHLRQILLS